MVVFLADEQVYLYTNIAELADDTPIHTNALLAQVVCVYYARYTVHVCVDYFGARSPMYV